MTRARLDPLSVRRLLLDAHYRTWGLPDNRVGVGAKPAEHARCRTAPDHQHPGVEPASRLANYLRRIPGLNPQFRLGAKALSQARQVLARHQFHIPPAALFIVSGVAG